MCILRHMFTDTDSPLPNILQETNMTVMSLPDCAAYWDQLWPDTPLHLFMGQICIFSGEDPVLGASACNVCIPLIISYSLSALIT